MGYRLPAVVTVDGEDIAISDEMLDHVVALHQLCRRDAARRRLVRGRDAELELLDLPEPLFGTADAMALHHQDRQRSKSLT